MRPNQLLVTILSATAITGGVLIGTTGHAQACWRTQLNSTSSNSQFPQTFNSTTASKPSQPFNSTMGKSAVGIAILGGLLAVEGIYLSRRRQSKPVADKAENQFPLPSATVDEQVSERELANSRK